LKSSSLRLAGLVEDIVALQQQGKRLVVVHGGGKLITKWLGKQKIATRFVRGERVTDKATLEVAMAVLAGLTNKELVAAINSLGGRAVGGYVGEVVKVDTAPLETLLQAGYVPVVATVGLHAFDRAGEAPPILNINGDLAAGEIAAAMGAERLIFLTDVAGVGDKSGKLLPRLSASEAEALIAAGVASGGMIPKIKACVRALATEVTTCIIDGRQPHALLREVEGQGGGTRIYKK
jgi:acetylglutamate kinase